jgi:hypothetical protein
VLLLKLTLAPALVAGVTLAGRRWGARVAGVLAALPVVAGPILFFVALDEGRGFAARAAMGTLAGLLATIAFCLAHAWAAERLSWPLTLAIGGGAVVAGLLVVGKLELGGGAAIVVALAILTLALRLMPRPSPAEAVARPRWWDLPLRMLATAGLVVAVTTSARLLGARWTGLLTPFPVATSVLAVFAHAQTGSSARLLRGLMTGLYGFIAFVVTIGATVERWGWASFGVGVGVAIAVNVGLLARRAA